MKSEVELILLENLIMKLNKEFNILEKVELVEYVESIMYDEDKLTVYEIYETDEKITNAEKVVDNYLSRLYNNEELEEFEETHFVDSIRGLVCTYESNTNEVGQIKLFMKLFKYFNR